MFWFCKKQTDEQPLNEGLSKAELQKKVDSLEQMVESYKKTIEKINADVTASTFYFDFNSVKAFSIERNCNDNRPVTIIGFFLPEARISEENGFVTTDVIREWYLYCDQEQHEKLVEQFKASKNKASKK